MPDLPTVTVTQAQLDRITQLFPGADTATKVQNYKNWLMNRLIDIVQTDESNKALANVLATMPTRPPDPLKTTQ